VVRTAEFNVTDRSIASEIVIKLERVPAADLVIQFEKEYPPDNINDTDDTSSSDTNVPEFIEIDDESTSDIVIKFVTVLVSETVMTSDNE
jgi:hypothetical protein